MGGEEGREERREKREERREERREKRREKRREEKREERREISCAWLKRKGKEWVELGVPSERGDISAACHSAL